jgi:hypothetical protein
MLKAIELKIGNLVNYVIAKGDVVPNVIDWQDLKWLSEDEQGFNLLHNPIPLTEEWLLKFGFKERQIRNGGLNISLVFDDEVIIVWVGVENTDFVIENEIALAYI